MRRTWVRYFVPSSFWACHTLETEGAYETSVKTRPFRGPTGEVVPGSIAEVNYLHLGGLDQWMMIRGETEGLRVRQVRDHHNRLSRALPGATRRIEILTTCGPARYG